MPFRRLNPERPATRPGDLSSVPRAKAGKVDSAKEHLTMCSGLSTPSTP